MSKALQQAAATFPAFNWNTATPEELRADLLSVELRRQLVALGGQIVEKDGQLVVARADHDYMDLYDSNHQKVDLAGLYDRVKGQATFKALTAEGQQTADPAPPQPGQLPEPKINNEAMRNAHRQSQEAMADFQRGQQEAAEREQRMAHALSTPAPAFTGGKPEPRNYAMEARKRAAEDSLAAFQRSQGQ